MFGFRYIKVQPTDYILQHKRGRVVREGAGLSFFYFAPTTSLVLIPIGSEDVPFIIEEVTQDFQQVTVQGQLTYRVKEPARLADLMNYTLQSNGRDYISEDPQKLPQRLISLVQVETRAVLKTLKLREALVQTTTLVNTLQSGLQGLDALTSLGIEVLALSILAVRPTPDTARALEAEAREQILLEADEAIYARRNAAVEQERAIKENELNTEIAVENKKRQIRETKMDADMAVQQKRRELREAEMAENISLEMKKKELVELASANTREDADARAYGLAAMVQALAQADPHVIQSLAAVGMQPEQLVAQAFRDLAGSADKIGQLNVSPDLLRELINRQTDR